MEGPLTFSRYYWNKNKNVSEGMHIHITGPSPPILIQQSLMFHLLSYMQKKCDYTTSILKWHSGFSLTPKSGSKMAFLVSRSLLWLLSSFYHRLFLCFLFSVSRASSVMFYEPATIDESFYVPSECALSHYLLSSILNFSGKQFFSLPATFSSFITYFLIWSLI